MNIKEKLSIAFNVLVFALAADLMILMFSLLQIAQGQDVYMISFWRVQAQWILGYV